MPPPKECNKCPVNGPSGMETHELTDKEFKIIVLKKLNELQETWINHLMKSGK